MGKTLIGPKNVDRHICGETNALYLDNSMILTCGAKDYLRNKGVSIVYGKRPAAEVADAPVPESCPPCTGETEVRTAEPSDCSNTASGTRNLEDILGVVLTALKEDHGITDPETLEKLNLAILSELG